LLAAVAVDRFAAAAVAVVDTEALFLENHLAAVLVLKAQSI
jgi:hypothetical protein